MSKISHLRISAGTIFHQLEALTKKTVSLTGYTMWIWFSVPYSHRKGEPEGGVIAFLMGGH